MSRKIGAALAALTLAGIPALAEARSPHHRRAQAPRTVTWLVGGKVAAVDAGGQTLTVGVRLANRGQRALRGRDVKFDVSHARLLVRDVNHDGSRNLADVAVNDWAGVMARLPRGTSLNSATTYPARLAAVVHPRGGYVDPFGP